jgi:hypothetical protein
MEVPPRIPHPTDVSDVERDFAWLSRFRRLARDQERLAEVAKGFHLFASFIVMWKHALPVLGPL